jgi:hypothetical protein
MPWKTTAAKRNKTCNNLGEFPENYIERKKKI